MTLRNSFPQARRIMTISVLPDLSVIGAVPASDCTSMAREYLSLLSPISASRRGPFFSPEPGKDLKIWLLRMFVEEFVYLFLVFFYLYPQEFQLVK